MAELGKFELWAWGLCFALQAGVLALLLVRGSAARFPAFTLYLAGSLAQNVAQFAFYRSWGFSSLHAGEAAWSMQGVVILLRGLAVLEVCQHVFGRYRGIWALIWRTMVIVVGLTGILAMAVGNQNLEYRILHADRAVGLMLALAIVFLLLFARYYQVQSKEPTRSIALGFFLYSCFVVLNDTVLERLLQAYAPMWIFLGTISFIGSVLVWGWALRQSYTETADAPDMLPDAIYKAMSPDVNRRLSILNDRLSHFSKKRVPKS
jgi:hypothetical protein